MADTPIKWDLDTISSNILSTDLDSKTSSETNINVLDSILDNSDGEYMNCLFELVLGSLNITAGGFARLLLWRSVDGTNYIKQHIDYSSHDKTYTFLAANGSDRAEFLFENLPPFKYKIGIIQATGSTTASSGNTLKYVKYREKGVS